MTTLTQKLQLKPDQSLKLANPPTNYAGFLIGEDISISDTSDAVLVFVNSLSETEQIVPAMLASCSPDALTWIAYPKGSSGIKTDVNRDKLWKALEPSGWRPVRQIALDAVWSALRFRPTEKVGK
jgi:hypothetical protein